MNMMEALRVWRRRWILTGVLLLLAFVVTGAAVIKLPRTYLAESTVTLLPSISSAKIAGGNPYLSFNGSLPLTAQIVAFQVLDPHTAQNLAARGYTQSYAVGLAPNTTGPVLQVTVTGSNKGDVERTLNGVTDEISTKLSGLQAGISHADQIGVLTLSVALQPSLSVSKTARPFVVILIFGLALALAVPLIVDGRVARRRTRASSANSAAREMTPQDDHGWPDTTDSPGHEADLGWRHR